MQITVTTTSEVDVQFLRASCGVRYWEDTTVNGVEDEQGDLIPCRAGDVWQPLIALDTGVIQGWPQGTVAAIHYKVCDAGHYELLSADMACIKKVDGYVPKIMCPKDSGYGDYVIMDVAGDGQIVGWCPNLAAQIGDDE